MQANRCAEEAVQLARRLDNPVGAGHALTALAPECTTTGVSTSGLPHSLRKRWHDFVKRATRSTSGGGWPNLSECDQRSRRITEHARGCCSTKLCLWRASGETSGVSGRPFGFWDGWPTGRATSIARRPCSTRAWPGGRRFTQPRPPHWSLHLLGLVSLSQGDLQQATHCLCESLALDRAAGDRWGMIGAWRGWPRPRRRQRRTPLTTARARPRACSALPRRCVR